MNCTHSIIRLTLCAVIGITLGCSAVQQPRQSTARIYWPPPPNRPLFEFIDIYFSDRDFPKNGLAELYQRLGGEQPLTLGQPYGIVKDSRGNIIVSNIDSGRLTVFNLTEKRVEHFPYSFSSPHGLALDADGNLYVADVKKKQVVVVSSTGDFIRTIGRSGQFERPMHVALNERSGRVYVSDARRHRISVFTLSGDHLFDFGNHGSAAGEFGMPHGIAISREQEIYVADMLNSRIQVFDEDGNYLRAIDKTSYVGSELEFPRDIAFTSDNHLLVIDIKRAVLVACSPDGTTKLVIGDEKPSSNPLGFSTPTSIYVDRDDMIHIADQGNKRFARWQYLSSAKR